MEQANKENVDQNKSNENNIGKNNTIPLEKVFGDEPRKKHAVSKTWERGFQSLVAFKKKHGHAAVPYRCDDDPALGSWVARQRKVKDELTTTQRSRLEELGFEWESTQDRAWMDKFRRLKNYWQKTGHSKVPTSYAEDPELGEWTAKQRQKYSQARLSKERQALLDSLGFVYRINRFLKRKSTVREDKKWWEQLERLVQFLLEHGHTLVPFAYAADKSLGRWVNEQRCQNMRGLLRQDRKDILAFISFVWKVSSRKGELPPAKECDADAYFIYRFRELVDFKKENGVYPTAENHSGELGNWADEQKRLMQAGKMEEMKAQRFAAIGFCDVGDDQIFEENLERLRSSGYDSIYTLEDPHLSHFVIIQRYLYKKGCLTTERKMELFEIPGFQWDSSPINLPQPEPKHAMKDKAKKRKSQNKSAQKANLKNVVEEDPSATSGEWEEDLLAKPTKKVKTEAQEDPATTSSESEEEEQFRKSTQRAMRRVQEDSSTSSESEEELLARPTKVKSRDERVENARGNFVGLLAIASEWRKNERG